jgi:aminoglycoside phosphotransferase (APT) family kinase protein
VPLKISADEARALLRERGHEAIDLEQLTGGMWSTTYAFHEKGCEYVIRFHDRRDDLEKDRFASRWESPALRTVRMTEIGDLPSGAYGISERVRGTHIDDLDAEGMRGVLPSLFDAMEAIRSADLSGTSGWGLWHGDGKAEHSTWRDMLAPRPEDRARVAAHGDIASGFDAGIARMRELTEYAPDRRYLVHNDLLYHNVLRDDRGVIVLDWGASIFGDFLYDVALLTFWWPWYARWNSIDIDALVRSRFAPGVPHFAERLRLCEMDIGVSHIASQLSQRLVDTAAWTARHTAERAVAPLG